MTEISKKRARAWAEVNLHAIRQNARLLKQRVGNAQLMAVVKANAYGHGAVPVSQAALEGGAERLCVATLEEGVQLREAGIHAPIHLLYPLHPSEIPDAVQHRFEITLDNPGDLIHFKDLPEVYAHLKLDTGMSRLGVQPEQLEFFLEKLSDYPQVKLVGVSTHFACADCDEQITREQLSKFLPACKKVKEFVQKPLLFHAANSAATLSIPESHLDGVRVGALLYGINLLPALGADSLVQQLLPVLSLKARVLSVREVASGIGIGYGHTYRATRRTRVATVGIGYADGYSRRLSNRGEVLLHGVRVPVIGRVCMDLMMVDVTAVPGVQTGDMATLIGQEGSETIRAEDLARLMETTPHEPTTVIGSRVPRLYSVSEAE